MNRWGKLLTSKYLYFASVGLLAFAVDACKNESEAGPDLGTDYYPVAVKDFRIYDVVDSTWQENVGTARKYQLRERVEEAFTDAAGQQAYRIVRSKRANAAANWLDDSTIVVNPSQQTLLLTTQNRRTVELVFPVRSNRAWNLNAYNSLSDTITAETRRYAEVGAPFKINSNGKTYSYPTTVTTTADDTENKFYPTVYRRVFAKSVGLVYRVARRYNYGCPPGAPAGCAKVDGYIKSGYSRTEVLVESGRM
ncbi:hypothetical protein [Hymenobacter sp. BT491]|uniref:hypothetical protein n=1 Tax=Hymenobacter sp. BT491 TaxID=2766779 RepID=UPI0016539F09|nr:hypothetical protein [Hymenobacter sp. BT491]MBC6989977.1 hypothetical protein [Hymenobacter sp. BT491]